MRDRAQEAAEMRAQLDALVETWVDRGWSMESASATLIGYGLHLLAAGRWQTLDQLFASVRAAWPTMQQKAAAARGEGS